MIFLPFSVPSSKNGKLWTGNRLISSKSVMKWKKDVKPHFLKHKELFLEQLKGKQKPYIIGFHFVKRTAHKLDFNNKTQTIQDEMVFYKWLEDDNEDIMLPFPFKLEEEGKFITHDKNNPGVYIKIFENVIYK